MNIKNKWFTFFVVMCACFFTKVYCLTDQEFFLQANEFYKQGEFEKALDVYQKIKNPVSVVLYNTGNCYFKLNKLGKALVYWRRAENNWGIFGKEELVRNISYLKKSLHDARNARLPEAKRTVYSVNGYKKIRIVISSFIRSAPLLFFQILFLIAWASLFIFLRKLLRRKQKGFVAILFFLIALLGSFLAIKYGLSVRKTGVVISKKSALLSGPGDSYKLLGTLYEGQEGIIKKESGNFYKIKIGNRLGWITQENFEKI